ncbi:MAG TPA: tetratricopeptide repeat protein, partial [Phycisphaerae bacterium]|nr:tetratricopeptide repeat protein [Phycisphaerae bacterium]
ALLSKTDICILPVVLLLLAWWKNGHIRRREILSLIPWLFIGGILAGITIYIEHGTAGAQGPVFAFSVSQRLIIAGKDFWFYPFKLLWPHPLLEVYPSWDVGHILPTDWMFGGTALGILVILWLLRKKIGRGVFTSVAFYGITISPLLGFISFSAMIYTFVTDHYQYLACIGIIVLVVELAANGFEKLGEKFAGGSVEHHLWRPAVLATGALLLELSVLTWTQCQLYKSPSAIWENVLTYDQNSWLALDQRGYYEYQMGDIKDAEQDERRAYQITGGNNFVADGTLGLFLLNTQNDYREGVPLLVQSLKINPYQPVCVTLLAYCYEHQGMINNALLLLKDGLNLMPNDPALNISMGEFLESQGQHQAALDHFKKALRYEPMNAACLLDVARVLEKSGREQEAKAEYAKAMEFNTK